MFPLSKVAFHCVSKRYAAHLRPYEYFKGLLLDKQASNSFGKWALQGVSFEAGHGETLCLIGANGSGKSTSLQLAAGILQPTEGVVEVEGRVAALLELGAGFHPEFSGRENVFLSGAIHGLTSSEIRKCFAAIERFAEIGEYLDRPVRTYSSGMLVRLAFAVAIHVEPDILLVDEALAVGDYYFRQRCMRKVHELRDRGVVILYVSHAMADVQALGDRVIWLEGGRIVEQGDPSMVVRSYLAHMNEKDDAFRRDSQDERACELSREQEPATREIPNNDGRFGSGSAEVLGISVLNGQGSTVRMLQPCCCATVRIRAKAKNRLEKPNIGFMIRNHLGLDFAGTNTSREGFDMPPMQAGEVRTIDFHIDFPDLQAGTLSFSPAIADGALEGYEICDWIENALVLPMVQGAGEVYGYIHLPCRVEAVSPSGV